jgi:hypothetical protein
MTLRDHITVLTAGAGATGIALVAVVVFVLERGESMGQVDAVLREPAAAISSGALGLVTTDVEEWPAGHARVVRVDGTSRSVGRNGLQTDVDPRALEVAAGERDRFTANVEGSDQTYRVLTVPLGSDIDEKHLPHVFERFYRASTARALPGAGLGLAIVREVADAHGWHASAGAAPGGSCLVRLDLRPDERRDDPEPSEGSGAAATRWPGLLSAAGATLRPRACWRRPTRRRCTPSTGRWSTATSACASTGR